MIKVCRDSKEIIFILNNLRDEDRAELFALWGADWFNKVLNSLKDKEVLILYDVNSIPVAMGGFYELFSSKIACAWLLSSKFIKENRFLLIKTLKNETDKALKKYDILYNYIYISNKEAKNWLKKTGFKFDNPKPKGLKVKDGFEFFYLKKER